jgi:hypothetical protein
MRCYRTDDELAQGDNFALKRGGHDGLNDRYD